MTDAALPCGCAGKTPLDRVVAPARERARAGLAERGISLVGALDCGLLPRRARLDRTAGSVALNDPRQAWDDGDASGAWGLTAVLAGRAGTSVEAFADVLERGYDALPPERLRVAKGHSVQVRDTDGATIAAELLRPRGTRRPGYVLANVDLVHEFPEFDPVQQARVAALHALNDCYAYGGTDRLTVRPVVAVPDDGLAPATVASWFREGVPDDVRCLPPTVVRHGGRGRLFGATTTAEIDHSPPVHAGRVAPGDRVLLHRPFGAVAALAATRNGDAADCDRATAALRADHAPVAAAIADARPDAGEPFDPARHLKLATDVSGPGIGGVADAVARSGGRLHVESLPFVAPAAVRRARERWLVPDATLGTNGPIALVGRPAVVDRLERRLRNDGERPVRLGRVVDGGGRVSTDDGVRLEQMVEDRSLHEGRVTGR